MTGDLRDRLTAYVQRIWNDGQLDRLPEFLHPDVTFRNADPALSSIGLPAAAEAIQQARKPFSSYQLSVEQTVMERSVLAWRWQVRAKFASADALRGDLRTLADTLEDLLWVDFSGICFTSYSADGLIIDEMTESNPIYLLQQTGALQAIAHHRGAS